MLRGLRWQLVLLIGAVLLLGVVVSLRGQAPQEIAETTPLPDNPPENPPEPDAASSTLAVPTPLPLPEPTSIPTFREGLVGGVQRLNPLFASFNPVDRDISSLIFEGLVGTNEYGEYVPALAHNWVISRNGLEYVFELREDVLWQDGIPFTAADVATTIALLQVPGSPIPEDLAAFWRTVEIALLGEYTVRFRLSQPLAAFPDFVRIGMLPAHVFDGVSSEQLASHPFNLSPIGTGPYQLERLIPGDDGVSEIALRVAPVFRQRPEGQTGYELERVVFRMYDTQEAALQALRAGEIDALGGVEAPAATSLVQTGIARTTIGLQPVIGVVLLNWESETTHAFRDQRVRRALIIGADRAGLVNRHLSGRAIPADSPFIPGSWAHSSQVVWPDYDMAAATTLLQNVEFTLPTPTPEPVDEEEVAVAEETAEETATLETPQNEVAFRLLCRDDPVLVALADDLAAQWSLLGIQVATESASQVEVQVRLESGQFDAALVELSLEPSADPDPYAFWHQGQYEAGQNYGGINDRYTSELLERARRDPNGLHRDSQYVEFQQAFIDRSLALLLYYPAYQYATSLRLQGAQLGYLSTATDRFRNIQDWTITP